MLVTALLLPVATWANETQLLPVRARPADTGERTYYIGAGASMEDAVAFRDALIAAGAWNVNLFVQDRVIVCSMPPGVAAAVPVPAVFSHAPADLAQSPAMAATESWGWIADAYARVDETPPDMMTHGEGDAAEPLDDVVLTVPPERVREIQREVERSMALDANAPRPQPARNMSQNSEILFGTILANFIFPESDGSLDANVENWSADDMREARVGTTGAFLAWQAWTQMDINTTFNLIEAVPTGYEPIMHDMRDDELWINDVMVTLGWGQQITDPLGVVHEFNEYQRSYFRTRWVVTGFIACARNTPKHRFGGGNANYTAYAYLGGPFMIEPFPAGTDPNGIGETLVFSKIVQHEMGHNFWTLDEYPGAPGGCGDTSGYLNYANFNISMTGVGGEELRCENLTPCIMHTAARIGQDRPWCRYSLGHLGVIDNNNNGYPDVFEAAPEVIFEPEGPETVSTNQLTLRFRVVSNAVPNRNRAQDPARRVDYAAPLGEVKFSLGATTGISLVPIDGHVDEAVEEFELPITLASVGLSAVVVRARNSVGYQGPPYSKKIYFTGVNYSHIGASVKEDRIDIGWETVGDIFGSKFAVFRLNPGEALPGTRIAEDVPPSGPGTAGFVPYRYTDRDVEPGRDYRYYVLGTFSLPVDGGTQLYESPSQIVGQTAAIPPLNGEMVSGIAPNPSNGNVTFTIQVPRTYDDNPYSPQRLATPVAVDVYDVRGRRIRQLADKPQLEDVLTLRWDGRNEADLPMPAGVYFVRIRAGDARAVRKIVLLH
jgi:hypothetical protein